MAQRDENIEIVLINGHQLSYNVIDYNLGILTVQWCVLIQAISGK